MADSASSPSRKRAPCPSHHDGASNKKQKTEPVCVATEHDGDSHACATLVLPLALNKDVLQYMLRQNFCLLRTSDQKWVPAYASDAPFTLLALRQTCKSLHHLVGETLVFECRPFCSYLRAAYLNDGDDEISSSVPWFRWAMSLVHPGRSTEARTDWATLPLALAPAVAFTLAESTTLLSEPAIVDDLYAVNVTRRNARVLMQRVMYAAMVGGLSTAECFAIDVAPFLEQWEREKDVVLEPGYFLDEPSDAGKTRQFDLVYYWPGEPGAAAHLPDFASLDSIAVYHLVGRVNAAINIAEPFWAADWQSYESDVCDALVWLQKRGWEIRVLPGVPSVYTCSFPISTAKTLRTLHDTCRAPPITQDDIRVLGKRFGEEYDWHALFDALLQFPEVGGNAQQIEAVLSNALAWLTIDNDRDTAKNACNWVELQIRRRAFSYWPLERAPLFAANQSLADLFANCAVALSQSLFRRRNKEDVSAEQDMLAFLVQSCNGNDALLYAVFITGLLYGNGNRGIWGAPKSKKLKYPENDTRLMTVFASHAMQLDVVLAFYRGLDVGGLVTGLFERGYRTSAEFLARLASVRDVYRALEASAPLDVIEIDS